jgi:hypothetical protein
MHRSDPRNSIVHAGFLVIENHIISSAPDKPHNNEDDASLRLTDVLTPPKQVRIYGRREHMIQPTRSSDSSGVYASK